MKNKLSLTIALLAISTAMFAQQDPLYNLYYYNQAMINPAYVGLYKSMTLNAATRQQWTGINGAPITNIMSFTSSLGERVGAGTTLVSDQLGINRTTEMQAAFSYKVINSNKGVLSLGLQGGLINYRYDYSKLNIQSLDDEDIDMNRTQFTQPNVGAGLFFHNENFYAGISVPRIMNVVVGDGVQSSTRYMRHYYISGGYIINNKFNSSIKLKPSFLLRMAPGGNHALDLNFHMLFRETIWAGITVRNFSTLGVSTQFQVGQRFRFAYSFELPTNGLLGQTYGTHELSVMLELSPMRHQQKVIRYF
ncbi:MAG: type IX secretion system membrane protein PorP/SprF [Bacteroidota bacterium]